MPAGRARPFACLPREIARDGLDPRDVFVELAALAEAARTLAARRLRSVARPSAFAVAVLEQGNGPARPAADPLPPISSASTAAGSGGRPPGRDRQAFRGACARLPIARRRRCWSTGSRPRRHCASPSIRGPICSRGPLLAPPALAGAVFPDEPLAIEDHCLPSGASSRLFALMSASSAVDRSTKTNHWKPRAAFRA